MLMLPPETPGMLRDLLEGAHPRAGYFRPLLAAGLTVTIDPLPAGARNSAAIGKPVSTHSLRPAFAVICWKPE